MSGRTDVDDLLRSWLADGSESAPDRHVLAALERIDTVPQQRRSWLPDLLDPTVGGESILRIAALGAATVGLIFALGVVLRGPIGNVPLATPVAPVASTAEEASQPHAPDGTDEPSATDEDGPTGVFVAPDGSTIRLPTLLQWHEVEGPDSSALYLTTSLRDEFSGAYIRSGDQWLTIYRGDSQGRVRTCDIPVLPPPDGQTWEECRVISGSTIEELASRIGLPGSVRHGPEASRMALDGEPVITVGKAAMAQARPGMWTTVSVKYVVAIHDGVPYVIRMVAQASGIRAPDLLAGFSFAEDESPPEPAEIEQPESVDGFRTFVAPDGSFEVRLPDEWERRRGADPTALYVTDGVTAAISLRFGDESGRIRQCDDTEIFGESCGMIEATSLAELGDAIALSGTSPMVHYGPRSFALRLGDEHATSISMVEGVSPPWGVRYVIAFHDGRPFILRASRPMPPDAEISLTDVLAGFSFVDSAGP